MRHVEGDPKRGHADEEEDEAPASVQLGDSIGNVLTPRQILFEFAERIFRRSLRQQIVRRANAVRQLAHDRDADRWRARKLSGEFVAREFEKHRVRERLHTGRTRLVVEDGELAEVVARVELLQAHGLARSIRGQEDRQRTAQHDEHRRAVIALPDDEVGGGKATLDEP